jgi:hypothetical protein
MFLGRLDDAVAWGRNMFRNQALTFGVAMSSADAAQEPDTIGSIGTTHRKRAAR